MAWYNKITVEVPLFFTFINFLMTGSIFTNLVIYRSCYVLLDYNKTFCAQLGRQTDNATEALEKQVAPTADLILMVKTIVESSYPICVCLIAGPWSDKNGRKPVLLMTLIGLGLSTFLMVFFSYFENLNPWYFLISCVPAMLSGGTTTYFTITLSYLSDMSTPETRGIRMAFYEAALASGVLIGSVSSSYIFYQTNYETIFGIGSACMLIGLIYTILMIPESLPTKARTLKGLESQEDNESEEKLITLEYFADLLKTTFKKRENYNRAIILLTMASIIIFSFETNGDFNILFVFLRDKLGWTLTKYTLYNSAHSLLWVAGTIVGTFVFNKKLKITESILALVGLSSILGCVILQALAVSDVYIYAAGVVRCLGGLVSPMLRSQVSRMVPINEAGKIFSMIVAGGALIGLGSSPLYTMIFNATITNNSATFNYFSIGLICFTALLVITIRSLESKSNSYPLEAER